MFIQREKNKELEARNRDLEKRLREEQALKETAQAKVRLLKKKGRDEKNGGEAAEDIATAKSQKKPIRASGSPEKGVQNGKVQPETPLSPKQSDNTANLQETATMPYADSEAGVNEAGSLATEFPVGQSLQKKDGNNATRNLATNPPEGQSVPKQAAAGSTKQPGLGPLPQEVQPTGAKGEPHEKSKATKPAQQSIPKRNDVAIVEATIAEKNLAELEAKSTPASASKVTTAAVNKTGNGKPLLPPIVRQRTNESGENKTSNTRPATGQLSAPNSPIRGIVLNPAANVAAEDLKQLPLSVAPVAHTNDNINGSTVGKDAATITRAATQPSNAERRINRNALVQRSTTGGAKIPSAIEFDPLKTAPASELKISLDGNGRTTPADVQSIPSMNGGGFANADVGLGVTGSGGYPVQNQYSQHFDASMAFPVVGIASMGYQQANGAFQQAAAMMPVAQQQFSQTMADVQNGVMPPSLSVLQQPFLQVSDQQSIHSMPVADFGQPMILIQPQIQPSLHQHQHARGNSMHDFSVDSMMSAMQDMARPPAHHSRTNSFQTLPNNLNNINPSWNQNAQQWSMMTGTNNMGQPATPLPPTTPDPFDELVSRRPMSAMPSNGK